MLFKRREEYSTVEQNRLQQAGLFSDPGTTNISHLCAPLCLWIQQPHTLKKLRYLADRDLGKESLLVSRVYGPSAQNPNTARTSQSQIKLCGRFKCLFASIATGTVSHSSNRCRL